MNTAGVFARYGLSVWCCLALAACSTATPTRVLESHGDAVRNMVAEQIYKPGDEVPDLDGEKGRLILQSYRQDVGNPKTVETAIIPVKLD